MIRFIDSLTKKREDLAKREEGFTLIELLVVVLIIGILAAIAIPVYIGVQNSAKDSATQADIGNAKTAVVAYFTAEGDYPADLTGLADYGYPGVSQADSTVTFTLGTGGAFCIEGVSPTTNEFYATESSGVADGPCP